MFTHGSRGCSSRGPRCQRVFERCGVLYWRLRSHSEFRIHEYGGVSNRRGEVGSRGVQPGKAQNPHNAARVKSRHQMSSRRRPALAHASANPTHAGSKRVHVGQPRLSAGDLGF